MQVTPSEVYQQIVKRSQSDPLIAEIIRSSALEAVLEKMQQQLPVEDDISSPELEAVEG